MVPLFVVLDDGVASACVGAITGVRRELAYVRILGGYEEIKAWGGLGVLVVAIVPTGGAARLTLTWAQIRAVHRVPPV